MIESSKSGRAKCRACKETIAKGVWRYGEEEVSGSFDGTYVRWYHLACAVDRRPTGTSRDLPTLQGVMPQTEWGRWVCQVQINRCKRKRDLVQRPLWVGLTDDGRAHVVCLLASGSHCVVTLRGDRWIVSEQGSLDDALAVLPEQIFTLAADALLQVATR